MINYFNTKENNIQQIEEYERNCWVSVVAPTDDEIKSLLDDFPITEDYISYPLDVDEKALEVGMGLMAWIALDALKAE